MFQNENVGGTFVIGHKFDEDGVGAACGATIRDDVRYDDDDDGDDIANNDSSLSLLRATAPGVSTHIT